MYYRRTNVSALILCAAIVLGANAGLSAAIQRPTVDPAKLKEIDRRVGQTPAGAAESIEALAQYLTLTSGSDLGKVRAIYEWIVRNIDYDVKGYQAGAIPDQSAAAVLKRRTAVCSGYARLFEALARESSVEAKEIIGFSRGAGYAVGSGADQKPDHAWSAVKIDGSWHLLDCTWAAGYLNAQNEFVRQRCEFYFLTPAEFFIYDHFPEDARWQLVDQKLDREQYEALVHVRPAFFENGLSLVSHSQGVIKSDCCFAMILGAPEDVLLSAQIIRGDQRDEASSFFIQRAGSQIRLKTAFAAPGKYVLRLFAKRATEETPYDWAADYLVEVQPGGPSAEGFPKTLSTFHERGVTLQTPLSGRLRSGEAVRFKLVAPGAESVAVVVGGKWSKLERNGDTFEGEAVAQGDTVQVAAKYSGSESHYVLLKYAVSS